MTLARVCVYCGSSDKISQRYKNAARRMGEVIAQQGMTIVYGAGNSGMMGAVADGAVSKRGNVWGIMPKVFDYPQRTHGGLARFEVVETMHERKARMADLADAFIALPGGFGTFEELFEIITWAQIGLHQKPIGILNVDGYYDPLLAMAEKSAAQGFVYVDNRKLFVCKDEPEALVQALIDFPSPDHPEALEKHKH